MKYNFRFIAGGVKGNKLYVSPFSINGIWEADLNRIKENKALSFRLINEEIREDCKTCLVRGEEMIFASCRGYHIYLLRENEHYKACGDIFLADILDCDKEGIVIVPYELNHEIGLYHVEKHSISMSGEIEEEKEKELIGNLEFAVYVPAYHSGNIYMPIWGAHHIVIYNINKDERDYLCIENSNLFAANALDDRVIFTQKESAELIELNPSNQKWRKIQIPKCDPQSFIKIINLKKGFLLLPFDKREYIWYWDEKDDARKIEYPFEFNFYEGENNLCAFYNYAKWDNQVIIFPFSSNGILIFDENDLKLSFVEIQLNENEYQYQIRKKVETKEKLYENDNIGIEEYVDAITYCERN